MATYRDLVRALRELELDASRPALVHASLSSFGYMEGGADVVAGALLSFFDSLVVPTFTYKTMITPEVGPPDNAMTYGGMADANKMAEFFRMDMPADPLMGVIAETVRQHPEAERSRHPILSFAGVNASDILTPQTYEEPLAPIRVLAEMDAWVLLLGIGHRVNTSIHLGERLAGRKTFVRWALTRRGVRTCPNFPSCSDGFGAIAPYMDLVSRQACVDDALLQAVSLRDVIEITRARIAENPLALLCDREGCPRCSAIRADVERSGG
jgi:aminoglycoside 3-N-acetyltransferase